MGMTRVVRSVVVGETEGRGREVRARAVLGAGSEEEEEGDATGSVAMGRLLLVFVAMAYGTLTVTLKLVFESQGAPAGVLGGVRGLMTVLCFAARCSRRRTRREVRGIRLDRRFGEARRSWRFGTSGIKVCATSLFYSRTPRE